MKKLFGLLTVLLIATFTLSTSSCSNEEEIPGIGEGKLGFALKLKDESTPNTEARTQASRLNIIDGFIQVKELELEVEGRNENGRFEREIEIKFKEIRKISLDKFNPDADFFINIPEGEYREIEVELDLIDFRNEPSIFLSGTFTKENGNSVLLRFEHFGDDIDFEVEIEGKDGGYFSIDRTNNPLALLEIKVNNWFSNVSNQELENATLTDGAIVISNNQNKEIYRKIINRISANSDIEIKLRN
ncbi:hypothetical protein ACFOUP_15755 [Belliella kenyensis]|uniref:DUF4382 domain-containing protein n=1 Tax=Belliella kenyensis TaxID=1472724 RepID=A0ABV8ERT0_9BACT|nr:hypothetical protein [Belliella kenyensis]MCH7401987.1 hypothetical protein [Belliella kenyensis]MDN3605151.1 hypothetical protein [Belliella kenyensis]